MATRKEEREALRQRRLDKEAEASQANRKRLTIAYGVAAVIVLVTIRNGLRFPARARILQKPFAVDHLLALVAADVTASRRRSVGP